MELDSPVVEHDRSRSSVCLRVCACVRVCACGFSWIRAHRVEKRVRDTGDDFYDQCSKIYTISSGWICFQDFWNKKVTIVVRFDPFRRIFFFFFFLFLRCRVVFFFFSLSPLSRIESFYVALDEFEGGADS